MALKISASFLSTFILFAGLKVWGLCTGIPGESTLVGFLTVNLGQRVLSIQRGIAQYSCYLS